MKKIIISTFVLFVLACELPLKVKEPVYECTTTIKITPRDDQSRILISRSASASSENRSEAEKQSKSQAASQLCGSITFIRPNDGIVCSGNLSHDVLNIPTPFSIPGSNYTGRVYYSIETHTCPKTDYKSIRIIPPRMRSWK